MPEPLKNHNKLTRWLEKMSQEKPEAFPGKGRVDYYDRFRRIEEYLNSHIHESVNLGAMKEDGMWLTDHGPEHINTVIDRASELVCSPECKLSPYETYILLVAIHFHDVGNIKGRDEHEKRITEIMSQISSTDSSLLGDDGLEKRIIRDVATAHGGHVGDDRNDKDTINAIAAETSLADIRVRLLAAIMRFADELADDYTRTSRYIIDKQILPYAAQAYHYYADRLREVRIEQGYVKLRFEIPIGMARELIGKGTTKKKVKYVYLIDEIYNRTLKMHLEKTYCMRYMRPVVDIETIDIQIQICTNDYMKVVWERSYRLEEKGYPVSPKLGIYDICPELKDTSGRMINGQAIKNILESEPI